MENIISNWLDELIGNFVYSGTDDNSWDNISHSSRESDTEQEFNFVFYLLMFYLLYFYCYCN
jgi:hypothetical protein